MFEKLSVRKNLYYIYYINLAVVLIIWANSSVPLLGSNFLLAIARLTGLLATFCALMQFVLIGRMPVIEQEFGLDKLARIHHKNGRWTYIFMIAHVSAILGYYANSLNSTIWRQLLYLVQSNEDLLKALIAIILFTTVFVTSLAIVRLKLKYEAWYFVHLIVYIAILLPFAHQIKLGGSLFTPAAQFYWVFMYIFVLGQFAVFRWIWPTYLFFKHRFKVRKIVRETDNSTNIYITGKNMVDFVRKSGQFMIFRFLDLRRVWEAHPFSLSWSAENKDIRITVKNSGDFTSQIQSIKPRTSVFVMGPYGIFTDKVLKKNKILFIAGGVGITPIRSLIEEFSKKNIDIKLLYSNKSEREIIFQNELDGYAKGNKLKINYFISDRGQRITKEAIAKYVKDYKDREIYLCGPEGFMDAVLQMLKELKVEEKYIHYEKFSLH